MSMHEMYDESAGWAFGPWRPTEAYDMGLEIGPDVGPEPHEDESEDDPFEWRSSLSTGKPA